MTDQAGSSVRRKGSKRKESNQKESKQKDSESRKRLPMQGIAEAICEAAQRDDITNHLAVQSYESTRYRTGLLFIYFC